MPFAAAIGCVPCARTSKNENRPAPTLGGDSPLYEGGRHSERACSVRATDQSLCRASPSRDFRFGHSHCSWRLAAGRELYENWRDAQHIPRDRAATPMAASDSTVTSMSLLAQIRVEDRDPNAWRMFVNRYGSRIYEWCLSRQLQAADAEDVTQQVLLKLTWRLGEFDNDRTQTFRGWLRRVTENAIIDFLRDRQHREKDAAGAWRLLELAEARRDLVARLEGAFDLELLDLARRRVQSRVEKQRWQAWEMMSIDQRSAEEVSQQLGMKIPSVYSNRYQVQKLIAAEIEQLEHESSVYWEQMR
jgi:RNA polymerase sigma factor (sigma-70 family)